MFIAFAVTDGLQVRPKYSGIMNCMKSVWHQEGLRGLYQGVTPNILGAGASWGLYFFLYVFPKAQTTKKRYNSLLAVSYMQCIFQLHRYQRVHQGRSPERAECHGTHDIGGGGRSVLPKSGFRGHRCGAL